MILTLDFFLLCLNMYSVLCVVSQYQEFAAGRGTASDDCEHRIPTVRYAVQPTATATATSCLSSRRTPTNNNNNCNETTRVTVTATATPTQSPTAIPGLELHLNSYERRSSCTTDRPGRKHVQFPDTTLITVTDDRTDGTLTVKLNEITDRCVITHDDEVVDRIPVNHYHYHHGNGNSLTTKIDGDVVNETNGHL